MILNFNSSPCPRLSQYSIIGKLFIIKDSLISYGGKIFGTQNIFLSDTTNLAKTTEQTKVKL